MRTTGGRFASALLCGLLTPALASALHVISEPYPASGPQPGGFWAACQMGPLSSYTIPPTMTPTGDTYLWWDVTGFTVTQLKGCQIAAWKDYAAGTPLPHPIYQTAWTPIPIPPPPAPVGPLGISAQ